jgi:hypothetical protein
LLDLARRDELVAAAAITGSMATRVADRWSDIDLFLGIADDADIGTVIEEWSAHIYRSFDALHHFDLVAPPAVYRAFFLPSCLEIDVGFTPARQFGPLGPHFRSVFGTTHPVGIRHDDGQPPAGDLEHLIGRGWHHVLHARSAIERARPWQAEYWISALRDHVINLACLRLGQSTAYAKGADELPASVTAGLADALVRSLDVDDLTRALAVAATALLQEVGRAHPELAGKLEAPIRELGSL